MKNLIRRTFKTFVVIHTAVEAVKIIKQVVTDPQVQKIYKECKDQVILRWKGTKSVKPISECHLTHDEVELNTDTPQ
jgi:hypothetical protein